MRARVGVYASHYVLKQKEFLICVVCEKNTHVVVALKKLSLCSFTKSVFQSSQRLVHMEWRLEQECMHSISFSKRRKFWYALSTKKVLLSLSNFALKKRRYAVSPKVFFLSSQLLVQMEWGLEKECMHPSRFWNRKIFWSGCLRKKPSCRCQILRSKKCRYAVLRKVLFNLVNYLFKWNEG